MKLKNILKRKRYCKIQCTKTNTNHIEIKAKINGVTGRFILDTGASNSCVDFSFETYFKLSAKNSDTKAAGAGAIDLKTQISTKNSIEIKSWKFHNFNLVLMDLCHVNTALTQHNAKPIHGIIGADILEKGNGIIDYKKMNLFLKKLVYRY